MKSQKKKKKDKKYRCQECGEEIPKEEYESNDGLCDTCIEEAEEFPIWEF